MQRYLEGHAPGTDRFATCCHGCELWECTAWGAALPYDDDVEIPVGGLVQADVLMGEIVSGESVGLVYGDWIGVGEVDARLVGGSVTYEVTLRSAGGSEMSWTETVRSDSDEAALASAQQRASEISAVVCSVDPGQVSAVRRIR